MTSRRLLVVDEDPEARDALLLELRTAGFDPTTSAAEAVAAIVVRVSDDAVTPYSQSVPVIAVVEAGDAELHLRAAIAGAVQCVTRDAVADAVSAALAPEAPSLVEQQRRARVSALEALTRVDGAPIVDDRACRVRLTRLERRPVRPSPSATTEGASRLARCTPKQRELLDAITRAGSVTSAAAALGTSRGTIYATLRRIAHRLQLRDSGELLRLIGAEDPTGRL